MLENGVGCLTWPGDVIHNQCTHSSPVVSLCDGSVPFLACCVPNLGLHPPPLNLQDATFKAVLQQLRRKDRFLRAERAFT